MPQQNPRPPNLRISDSDWEAIPKPVQAILAQQQKQIRFQGCWGWLISIGLVMTITFFIAYLFITLRPYVRVRAEREQLVCVYRPQMVYIVQPRDTLFGLSLHYEVPVSVLASANDIRDINSIDIGDEIFIPDSVCVAPAVNTRIADDYSTATAIYLSATPTLKVEQIQATETRAAVQLARTQDFWETATALSTPPDLTRTTATPIPDIDPLDLTATHVIEMATLYTELSSGTPSS